jgi:hypothetical protein
MFITSMSTPSLDRELKKGSAELIILSILETRPRHGYEICKLIEQRSRGAMRFHVASRSADGCRASGSRRPVNGGAASTP